jgi:hypothetical protein
MTVVNFPNTGVAGDYVVGWGRLPCLIGAVTLAASWD